MMMLRSLIIFLWGMATCTAVRMNWGDWQAAGTSAFWGLWTLMCFHFLWPVRARHD